MNPELLLAHFNRISKSPEAVPRLRKFILELAVRGKLVEQDSTEEPASELMRTIQAEKARLMREGEIKKLESFEPVTANDVPFPIPRSWEVIRMGWLARKLGAGSTPLGGKSVYQEEGVPFLRSQNVYDNGLRLDDVALISRATHDKMSGTHIRQNDILLNITGASIGRCSLVPATFAEGNVSQHVAIIRLFLPAIREFIHMSLISPFFQQVIDDVQVGVSREGLSMQRLRLFPMLLPPLAEQHRIVTRVNELMALCDRLERAFKEQEDRRDHLAAASLHLLDNGANAETFRNHARFYLSHFPRLTTRPEDIQRFRRTILSLAVRGQLVPQDAADESASELLKRIQGEKATLTKEGRLRKEKPLPAIPADMAPFELPSGWLWARFGEIIEDADAGWSPKSESFPRSGHNWGVLKVSAVSWDKFLPEENKQLLPGVAPREAAQVHAGDFLISRANTSELVAKCVVVEQEPQNLILSDKIVRLQISENCSKHFVSMVNNHASHARAYYAEEASGTSFSMKNVSREVIYGLVIPLAPQNEQRRIVAKVDELMSLCDQLERQLTVSTAERRRLLDAVLYNALSETASARSSPSGSTKPNISGVFEQASLILKEQP
jgi:type I restriction enzyme, S subunit